MYIMVCWGQHWLEWHLKKLRALKIKKSEIHLHKVEALQKLLNTSKIL
ncbi:hypothetical protein L0663_04320 [Dyadobacter sp. CY107]|nr:hypothetical protein [Dyadobacter fanqingshengii]MCF2502589.1 hypothetical protein [Dyadobacter fanqingshengii]